LLAFFVVSCLSIILIVQSVSNLIGNYSRPKVLFRNENRAKYAQLLAHELETKSDRNQEAARWDHDLAIGLRIENFRDGQSVVTSPQIATFADVEREADRRVWTPEFKTGEFQNIEFAIVTLKERRYLFLFRSAPFQELQLQWLSPMTALIAFILFANFILIRWLFLPVNWLSDGIRRLGEGDFEVQIPVRSYDELGDLAVSFNETVSRIQHIVESKRQLLFDVSHELRSPLTRIRVALELSGPKAIEHIRKNVLLLESMIHDLLESARLDFVQREPDMEKLDLTEIVISTIGQHQWEAPGIVFSAPEKPLFLLANRKQIEICTKNVLDNAVKYSAQQNQPVQVSVETINKMNIRVRVRDFGLGIPTSERDLIFEPFYRVDKSRVHQTGGYGLGLSLCRKIMLAHGGQIGVSEPDSGAGAVFTLEFPQQAFMPSTH
jgi:signal transduction histidine kinase